MPLLAEVLVFKEACRPIRHLLLSLGARLSCSLIIDQMPCKDEANAMLLPYIPHILCKKRAFPSIYEPQRPAQIAPDRSQIPPP